MKNRFWIFIVILTMVILAIVYWWRLGQRTAILEPKQETVQLTNQSVGNVAIDTHNNANELPTTTYPTNPKPSVVNTASVAEVVEKLVNSRNASINFYGRFIDQYSNPVPDVKMKFGIERLTAPNPALMEIGAKNIQLERTTDGDGRIEIHGEIGDGLGIGTVTKVGYLLSPKAPHGFGTSSGSYENPVIFKMWKEGEKPQLVGGSKFWSVTPDGQAYTIDLLKQSKVESSDAPGDIRIRIMRPAQIKPRTHFDWSFSIEAIQGGLVETEDEFMYLAPESGYEPSYQFTMVATNANWKRELDGFQFYLKSRDGQVYGRFVFDIIPDYNDTSVFNVNWAANPNGSRNLQP